MSSKIICDVPYTQRLKKFFDFCIGHAYTIFMLLKKGFKFQLDPTTNQKHLFVQFAGASRFLYNRGLEQRKVLYEKEGKSIKYFEQNNELVLLKKQEATLWLKDIHICF